MKTIVLKKSEHIKQFIQSLSLLSNEDLRVWKKHNRLIFDYNFSDLSYPTQVCMEQGFFPVYKDKTNVQRVFEVELRRIENLTSFEEATKELQDTLKTNTLENEIHT